MPDGELIPVAIRYLELGLSPLPITPDKKKPQIEEWHPLQKTPLTTDEIQTHWKNGAGIGIVCGKASGNFEGIDFDCPDKDGSGPPAWDPFKEVLKEFGKDDLWARLVREKTPGSGWHIYYRHLGAVRGNTKLASDAQNRTTIETRGEGGYLVCAPTPGYCFKHLDFESIPVISEGDREFLWCVARMLDKGEQDEQYWPSGVKSIGRPGDDFILRGESCADILLANGWRPCKGRSKGLGGALFTRPGKDANEPSGSVTDDGILFYCYTTNAHPLKAQTAYNKFTLWAALHHNNDYGAAARELAGMGYGDQKLPASNMKPVDLSQARADRASVKWTLASDVKETQVEWLWKPYIPIGEVTLMAGDGGAGKSTIAQAIIAAVTAELTILGHPLAVGNAIFMSAEQAKGSVTVPRFRIMGAKLDRIILPDDEEVNADGVTVPVPFILDQAGVETLEQIASEFKPKIIAVDTITAYIEAARDMNTSNHVREWMRRLTGIARRHRCAILLLGHLNKATGQKGTYRVAGSADFVAASRSVLMVGKDPDTDQWAISHEKSNVGALGKAIGYHIERETTGAFTWTKTVDTCADKMFEMPKVQESKLRRDDCRGWLEQCLRDGPVNVALIKDEANELGYKRYTLEKAVEALGVRFRRVGKAGERGTKGAVWMLPDHYDEFVANGGGSSF